MRLGSIEHWDEVHAGGPWRYIVGSVIVPVVLPVMVALCAINLLREYRSGTLTTKVAIEHAVVCIALGLVVGGVSGYLHWLRGERVYKRSGGSRDLCRTCGYDLRATPARCPECGGVPAAPAAR